MATITGTTVEEIRSRSEELGVEFYFAQFVDMYGRPSAKLVPAGNLDDLASELDDDRTAGGHGQPPGSSSDVFSSTPSMRFIDWIA